MIILAGAFIIFFITNSILKRIAKHKRKKPPEYGKVLISSLAISFLAWGVSFIMSFNLETVGGQVAFVFVGIPILLILFTILIA